MMLMFEAAKACHWNGSTFLRRRLLRNVSASCITSKRQFKVTTSPNGSHAISLTSNFPTMAFVAAFSLTAGFMAGRNSFKTPEEHDLVLPNGLPRSCCDSPTKELTLQQQELYTKLRRIVGKNNLFEGGEENTHTTKFLKGARLGHGKALAIVQPTKLTQVEAVVKAVVDAGCVVLVQGSNTGLTGGSVPRETDDERPTVIVSMKHFDTAFPIDDGKRMVCLAGMGLASLKRLVSENFPDRESHSILGSTFLNPTTAAGVAFGSGGTQCRKGPAWTERALYLKVVPDKYGKNVIKIVNRLGIEGFDSKEGEFESELKMNSGILHQLDLHVALVKGEPDKSMKKSNTTYGREPAHDTHYKENICKLDGTVSRYNADTKGCECNRSEGKVLILASVHDTFQAPTKDKTYWLSFADLDAAQRFRSQVCLDNPEDIPVSMEYMDRDTFDVIDRAGRMMGDVIKILGTSSPIVNQLWAVKLWIEGLNVRGASTFVDNVFYFFNPIFPAVLPRQIMDMGRAKDHHIAITIGDFDGSLNRFDERFAKFQRENKEKIDVYECTTSMEKAGVTSFRFIAAPAFRTYCVGAGLQGVSVDYALPKNYGEEPQLPPTNMPVKRLRYSHFGCNVVHEDLAYEQGVDTEEAKMELKRTVDNVCKGKLPAEHGHGTEYHAPKDTQKRWQKMDPLNVMNPGVGGLSSNYRYKP
jgi:D-lactate dehydrogenase (quinone)